MEKEDRGQRLKDIEWAFSAIEKWARNPSQYRKSHQNSIFSAIHSVRPHVKSLMKENDEIVVPFTQAALAQMLRELPVSVTITQRDDCYIWQFLEGSGSAETFIDAMKEALTYLEAARMKE